jgi:hypothetical protein
MPASPSSPVAQRDCPIIRVLTTRMIMMVRFRHGRNSTLGTCRPRLWTVDGLGTSDNADSQDDVADLQVLRGLNYSSTGWLFQISSTRGNFTPPATSVVVPVAEHCTSQGLQDPKSPARSVSLYSTRASNQAHRNVTAVSAISDVSLHKHIQETHVTERRARA